MKTLVLSEVQKTALIDLAPHNPVICFEGYELSVAVTVDQGNALFCFRDEGVSIVFCTWDGKKETHVCFKSETFKHILNTIINREHLSND